MKVYRTIVIVIAIILGISVTTLGISSPTTQVAIKEPVTEEYYEYLKENALIVAEKLDKNAIKDETLTADFNFNEDKLVVTVESIKAKIIAKIPISDHSLKAEKGTIIFKGTAIFENIEYVEINQLQPAWWYILMSICAGVFAWGVVYIILFRVWFFPEKQE